MSITPVAADFSKYPSKEKSRSATPKPCHAPRPVTSQPDARDGHDLVSVEADFSRYRSKVQKGKEVQPPGLPTPMPTLNSTTPVQARPPPSSSSQARAIPAPQVDGMKEWWISRVLSVPESSVNGWVLSCMLDEYSNESFIAKACEKPTFDERVASAGLEEAFNSSGGPRKRCKLIAKAGPEAPSLMNESAQRAMIAAISASLPAYSSGIKCWAAFCDAMGWKVHFPATEEAVMQYASLFNSPETFEQYK